MQHPRGWKWVRLTGLAELVTGHTPARNKPEYWNGGISWINLNEIRDLDGVVCEETRLQISELGVANSSAVVHPVGTVCMSRTASVGFVTQMGERMATSQDFVNWVCGPAVDPGFLMKALIASRPHLVATATGSTHKTLYVRDAEKLHVLLPPIEEQRRIATVLDAVEALRAKRRQALAKLDSLLPALFHDMFGDPSNVRQWSPSQDCEPVRWPHSILSDVATIERETVRPAEVAGHELYVGMEHIDGRGQFEGVEAAARSGLQSNKFVFTKDHVLYGKLRPYLSKIGAPDFAGICSTDILPIRPGSRLDRCYLLHYLRTPTMVAHATNNAVGINLPRLSPKVLESFAIPVPPIKEQRRFGVIAGKTELLRARQLVQLDQMNKLFDSLQQRAFRGEL